MTKNDLEIGQALASVLTPITHIAGFAVGLTGLAYCLGWGFLNGYFGELGAIWIVPLLDTMQIVQVVVTPLFSMALLAGLHLYFYSEGILKQRGLRIICLTLVGVGIVSFGLHYAVLHFLGDQYKSYWLVVSVVCAYCFLPTVAISEVAAVAERRTSPGKVAMFAYGYGLLSVIAFLSPLLGKWFAQSEFTGENSYEFPFVTIGSEAPCKWHLVRAIGVDRVLLAQAGEGVEKPVLRVVSVDALSQVSADAPRVCIDDPDKPKAAMAN